MQSLALYGAVRWINDLQLWYSYSCVCGHSLIGSENPSGGAMGESPRIYRACVSGSIRNILVVVLERPTENSSQIAKFAQYVLKLPTCRDYWEEWPFGDSMPLQQFLEDVHPSLGSWSHYAMYMQHQQPGHETVHALGLGPKRVLQERAALLGLALCALLSCDDAPRAYPMCAGRGGSFAHEVAMSRRLPVKNFWPPVATGVLHAKLPGATNNVKDIKVEQSTVPEGVKLPEVSLLQRWQGIRVPWMPERPDEPLQRKDLKDLEPVPEATFLEILTRARASFEEIRRKSGRDRRPEKGRFFFDLTKSFRPWPCIIAAHSERARIVGNGIKSFRLVMDEKTSNLSTAGALLFFEVEEQGGRVHTFHSLTQTHQTMRPLRSEEDVSLAFQMALGQGAVSDALRQFQSERRPTGWQPDDFIPPGRVHHWTISESLQQSFTGWLAQRQQRPTSTSETRPGTLRDGMLLEWEKSQAHRFGKLDPAVHAGALDRFKNLVETFSSDDDDVRHSHQTISERFLHGHPSKTIDDLMSELRLGVVEAMDIPPLVAVMHQEMFYVIMGNRRLYAYQHCGRIVVFRMIVHKFPDFPGTDPAEREALTVKTLQAASSTTAGQQGGSAKVSNCTEDSSEGHAKATKATSSGTWRIRRTWRALFAAMSKAEASEEGDAQTSQTSQEGETTACTKHNAGPRPPSKPASAEPF